MKSRGHTLLAIGIFLILALMSASTASAQVVIKVNDDAFFKLGLLLQTQAEALEDPVSGSYAQNVFVRRVRLLLGGQISKQLSFFVETDSPNLGKSVTAGTKNNQPSMYLQDAYVEWKVSDRFALNAGLMLPSPSRNGVQSAASLLPVDYGPYTFANSAPTQSSVGRDTGIQARGYLASKRLEYRAGVFQGMRDKQNRELRFTGRLQYNFLETESGFFYTGTNLGKKKVFALGGGIDRQHEYSGYAVDAFFDHPVKGGALTAQVDHIRYDGGSFLKSLPEQRATQFQAGYLIGKTRVMPVVQISQRTFSNGTSHDENRYGAGLNYFISGHNANIKAIYTQIDNDGLPAADQVVVQIQFFYY